MSRPIVLAFCDYYLPGNCFGSPVRAVSSVVDRLSEEFDFRIVTRNHDFNSTVAYDNVSCKKWHDVAAAQVRYLSETELTDSTFVEIIQEVCPDLIYLNSCFSPAFTIRPLWLRWRGRNNHTPVILAPRGECSKGSMSIKSYKKQSYVWLAKQMRLYHGITWQASTKWEKKDVTRVFGKEIDIFVAKDLLPKSYETTHRCRLKKQAGCAKVLFLARISPEENLLMALRVLSEVQGKVVLNIVGPVGEPAYWQQCQELINQMPANISIQWLGEVPHEQVVTLMAQHDLFLLPSFGENFGHVVAESLIAGTPVLLSNRTPWKNLVKKGAGWDLPLEEPELWRSVLEEVIQMDQENHLHFSEKAALLGRQTMQEDGPVNKMKELFQYAMTKTQPKRQAA